ncbi:hypothetical protein C0Q70_16336 [Pomacea canaliculata]|uniref:Brix domain-containing protein n=1 Tax=Pomacea canaliculata TaxID=400727 RepID=A0A2T7NPH5_POMCA|nr:hypothetical protein C0Q70_16336 [Pomacea canaliculata]
MKRAKKKAKLQEKKKKVREAKAMGEKAPPKQVPKTLENMRVFDETMVDPEDEEVAADEEQDELSSYFHRDTVPKILITTTDRPSSDRASYITAFREPVARENYALC